MIPNVTKAHSRSGLFAGLACVSLALVLAVLALLRSDSSVPDVLLTAGAVSTAEGRPEAGRPKGDGAGALTAAEPAQAARAPIPVQSTAEPAADAGACDPGTICGVVLTRGGRPRPGAVCSLYPSDAPLGVRFARGLRGSQAPVASALSDSSGAFVLPAPSGHWTLQVEYVGLRRWREESVASGSYRRVLLERARVLVLHVENEQGTAVSDAQVLLLEDPYSNPGSARAKARSDAAGRAEIELQPGGSWFVEVSHPSYRSAVLAAPAAQEAGALQRTVTLTRGIRVFGRVTDSRPGRTPAGAEVLIDCWCPRATQTIPCDAEGRFDSGPVFDPDVELELTARAPGYAEARSVVELASAEVKDGALEVDFVLDSEEVRVLGRVVTRDGLAPGGGTGETRSLVSSNPLCPER